MSFEQERIAKERHDLMQRSLHKRFSSFDGRPSPIEIVALVNAAIGDVEPTDVDLRYDFEIEEAP